MREGGVFKSFFSPNKTIALCLCVCMSVTEIHAYAMASNAAIQPPHASSSSDPLKRISLDRTPGPEGFEIPERLGVMDGTFAGSSGKNIFYLQDAHGQISAQRGMAELLAYLRDRYEVETVFIEGALPGPVSPELLRFFEEDSINSAISELLLKMGNIGGPELFLRVAGDRVRAFGVEDPKLYAMNLLHFRRVYSRKEESEKFLTELRRHIAGRISPLLNPDLKEVLDDWLGYRDSRRELFSHVRRMGRHAWKFSGIDFKDPRHQDRYPQLVRFFRLMEIEASLTKPGAAPGIRAEKEKFMQWFGAAEFPPEAVDSVNRTLEAWISGKAPPEISADWRRWLEVLYEKVRPRGFRWEDFPGLGLFFSGAVLREEISAVKLFEEIESLVRVLIREIARTEEDKEALGIYEDYYLLNRLLHLELDRAAYESVKTRKEHLRPSVFGGRFGVRVKSGDRDKSGPDRVFDEAFLFYEKAREREEVIVRNMLERMTETGARKAVLIAGGFHREGLLEGFKEHSVSWHSLMPRIKFLSEKDTYENQMMLRLQDPGLYNLVSTSPGRIALPEMEKILGPRDPDFHRKAIFAAAVQVTGNTFVNPGPAFDLHRLFPDFSPETRSELRSPASRGLQGFELGKVLRLAARLREKRGKIDFERFGPDDFEAMTRASGFERSFSDLASERTDTLERQAVREQAVHDAVRNALDWSVYEDGRAPDPAIQSGFHKESALRFLRDLHQTGDWAMVETRKAGGRAVRMHLWKDGPRYRLSYEYPESLPFEHGTKITVSTDLNAGERIRDLHERLKINTLGEVTVNGKRVNHPEAYDYIGPTDGNAIEATSGVKVEISAKGYQVQDYGAGMDLEDIFLRFLAMDEEQDSARRTARTRAPGLVKMFASGQTAGRSKITAWVGGHRIEVFHDEEGEKINLLSEMMIDFPPGTPYPNSSDLLVVDDKVIAGVKSLIDRLTDPEAKIPNRFAKLNTLAVFIRYKQPAREFKGRAEDNLLNYLARQTRRLINQTMTGGMIEGKIPVPNSLRIPGSPYGWSAFDHSKFLPIDPDLFDFNERLVLGHLRELGGEEYDRVTGSPEALEKIPVYVADWEFEGRIRESVVWTVMAGKPAVLIDGKVYERNRNNPEWFRSLFVYLAPEIEKSREELGPGAKASLIPGGPKAAPGFFKRLLSWVRTSRILRYTVAAVLILQILISVLNLPASRERGAPDVSRERQEEVIREPESRLSAEAFETGDKQDPVLDRSENPRDRTRTSVTGPRENQEPVRVRRESVQIRMDASERIDPSGLSLRSPSANISGNRPSDLTAVREGANYRPIAVGHQSPFSPALYGSGTWSGPAPNARGPKTKQELRDSDLRPVTEYGRVENPVMAENGPEPFVLTLSKEFTPSGQWKSTGQPITKWLNPGAKKLNKNPTKVIMWGEAAQNPIPLLNYQFGFISMDTIRVVPLDHRGREIPGRELKAGVDFFRQNDGLVFDYRGPVKITYEVDSYAASDVVIQIPAVTFLSSGKNDFAKHFGKHFEGHQKLSDEEKIQKAYDFLAEIGAVYDLYADPEQGALSLGPHPSWSGALQAILDKGQKPRLICNTAALLMALALDHQGLEANYAHVVHPGVENEFDTENMSHGMPWVKINGRWERIEATKFLPVEASRLDERYETAPAQTAQPSPETGHAAQHAWMFRTLEAMRMDSRLSVPDVERVSSDVRDLYQGRERSVNLADLIGTLREFRKNPVHGADIGKIIRMLDNISYRFKQTRIHQALQEAMEEVQKLEDRGLISAPESYRLNQGFTEMARGLVGTEKAKEVLQIIDETARNAQAGQELKMLSWRLESEIDSFKEARQQGFSAASIRELTEDVRFLMKDLVRQGKVDYVVRRMAGEYEGDFQTFAESLNDLKTDLAGAGSPEERKDVFENEYGKLRDRQIREFFRWVMDGWIWVAICGIAGFLAGLGLFVIGKKRFNRVKERLMAEHYAKAIKDPFPGHASPLKNTLDRRFLPAAPERAEKPESVEYHASADIVLSEISFGGFYQGISENGEWILNLGLIKEPRPGSRPGNTVQLHLSGSAVRAGTYGLYGSLSGTIVPVQSDAAGRLVDLWGSDDTLTLQTPKGGPEETGISLKYDIEFYDSQDIEYRTQSEASIPENERRAIALYFGDELDRFFDKSDAEKFGAVQDFMRRYATPDRSAAAKAGALTREGYKTWAEAAHDQIQKHRRVRVNTETAGILRALIAGYLGLPVLRTRMVRKPTSNYIFSEDSAEDVILIGLTVGRTAAVPDSLNGLPFGFLHKAMHTIPRVGYSAHPDQDRQVWWYAVPWQADMDVPEPGFFEVFGVILKSSLLSWFFGSLSSLWDGVKEIWRWMTFPVRFSWKVMKHSLAWILEFREYRRNMRAARQLLNALSVPADSYLRDLTRTWVRSVWLNNRRLIRSGQKPRYEFYFLRPAAGFDKAALLARLYAYYRTKGSAWELALLEGFFRVWAGDGEVTEYELAIPSAGREWSFPYFEMQDFGNQIARTQTLMDAGGYEEWARNLSPRQIELKPNMGFMRARQSREFSPLYLLLGTAVPLNPDTVKLGEALIDEALKLEEQKPGSVDALAPVITTVRAIAQRGYFEGPSEAPITSHQIPQARRFIDRLLKLAYYEFRQKQGTFESVTEFIGYLNEWPAVDGRTYERRIDMIWWFFQPKYEEPKIKALMDRLFPFPGRGFLDYLMGGAALSYDEDEVLENDPEVTFEDDLLNGEIRDLLRGRDFDLAWLVDVAFDMEENREKAKTTEDVRRSLKRVLSKRDTPESSEMLHRAISRQKQPGMVMIRELIQNARDITRGVLGNLKEALKRFGGQKEVRVRSYLTHSGGMDRWILSVEDAVGMTLDVIIKKYFPPKATTKSPLEIVQGILDQNLAAPAKLDAVVSALIDENKPGSARAKQAVKDILEGRQASRDPAGDIVKACETVFRKAKSAGFFGVGNYTVYHDADGIVLRSGIGGMVYRIRISVRRNGAGEVTPVVREFKAFRDPGGKYQGTLVQRVKDVKEEERSSLELEDRRIRFLFSKYVGAVTDVNVRITDSAGQTSGAPILDRRTLMAEHGQCRMMESAQRISRVTVDELYVEDTGGPVSFRYVPQWGNDWIAARRINFEFPSAPTTEARTGLLYPEADNRDVAAAAMKGFVREYRRGSFKIPGLPALDEFLKNPLFFFELPLRDRDIREDAAVINDGGNFGPERWARYMAEPQDYAALAALLKVPGPDGRPVSLEEEKLELYFGGLPDWVQAAFFRNQDLVRAFEREGAKQLPAPGDPAFRGQVTYKMLRALARVYARNQSVAGGFEGPSGIRGIDYAFRDYLGPSAAVLEVPREVKSDLDLFARDPEAAGKINFDKYRENPDLLAAWIVSVPLENGESINDIKAKMAQTPAGEETARAAAALTREVVLSAADHPVLEAFRILQDRVAAILENAPERSMPSGRRLFRFEAEWDLGGEDLVLLDLLEDYAKDGRGGEKIFEMILNKFSINGQTMAARAYFNALLASEFTLADFRPEEAARLAASLEKIRVRVREESEKGYAVQFDYAYAPSRSELREPGEGLNIQGPAPVSEESKLAVANFAAAGTVADAESEDVRGRLLEALGGDREIVLSARGLALHRKVRESHRPISVLSVVPADLGPDAVSIYAEGVLAGLAQADPSHEVMILPWRGDSRLFEKHFRKALNEIAASAGLTRIAGFSRRIRVLKPSDLGLLRNLIAGRQVIVTADMGFDKTPEFLASFRGFEFERLVTDRLLNGVPIPLNEKDRRNLYGKFVAAAFETLLVPPSEIDEQTRFLVQGEDKRWYLSSVSAIQDLSQYIAFMIQRDLLTAAAA